jgi:hypothetical protein
MKSLVSKSRAGSAVEDGGRANPRVERTGGLCCRCHVSGRSMRSRSCRCAVALCPTLHVRGTTCSSELALETAVTISVLGASVGRLVRVLSASHRCTYCCPVHLIPLLRFPARLDRREENRRVCLFGNQPPQCRSVRLSRFLVALSTSTGAAVFSGEGEKHESKPVRYLRVSARRGDLCLGRRPQVPPCHSSWVACCRSFGFSRWFKFEMQSKPRT